MLHHYGRDDQKREFIESQFTGERRIAFGLTEPGPGLDATHMGTRAVHELRNGEAGGITCFLVPNPTPGLTIEEYLWTFNMPTDHPRAFAQQCVGGGRGDVRTVRGRSRLGARL